MKSIPPALLLLLASLPVRAQQATTAEPPSAPLPDIEFAADVHMQSVRFDSDPQAQVTFSGGPKLDTRHDVERENLPKPVAGGTSYRDVTVRTTISATLLDPATAPGAPTPASLPPPEDRP